MIKAPLYHLLAQKVAKSMPASNSPSSGWVIDEESKRRVRRTAKPIQAVLQLVQERGPLDQ